MNKHSTAIAAAVISTLLFSGLFLSAPFTLTDMQMPLFNVVFAQAAENVVELEAEVLPNGQYAYKMVSHTVDGDDLTDRYSEDATIPGPTIVINEGESLDITVTNSITGVNADLVVEGFDFDSAETGTYVYKGQEGSLVGLFGAIVVNDDDGTVQSYVDGGTGEITVAELSEVEKEFVLFMVGSTFWAMEIDDDGNQKPLWTNPMLSAVEGDIVRFHVLSVGPGHTFHLHAHRWVEPGTSSIIDTKLMEPNQDVHVFTVAAGDEVGPGDWQYHCHVFAHMEAGMHGIFRVVESGSAISQEGASPYGGHPLLADDDVTGLVTFEISDEPGSWFRNTLDISSITKTRSLALATAGDSVNFIMSDTNTVHTITSLLWPDGAENMPMDEVQSYKGGGIVELTDEGLYVFTCKIHPYMFGAVIVDDVGTEGLELGNEISLVNGLTIPTTSDLALRLLKTFFVATTPENWKDYTQSTWNPSYPAVPVIANGVPVADLDALLEFYFNEAGTEAIANPGENVIPPTPGVGEVWVDTQFEKTEDKYKPGTATAIDVEGWTEDASAARLKVSLPDHEMNNPHNMWTDHDQEVIYQTEWFDNKLVTFDREDGSFLSRFEVGESPSHVMTRVDTGDIHVALNGEEGVAEILESDEPTDVDRIIPMQGYGQNPTHPHAHWMSSDGQKMVTPNSFTHDSTLYGFDTEEIEAKPATGILPIATGMMPDDSKYYVANLLSSTISVIDMDTGTKIKDINLLEDYNPLSLDLVLGGANSAIVDDGNGRIIVGALPIQTPVSPDGKYMVTANTLTATLVITDTTTDEAVMTLECDPGCHGVQFGAKEGGGYYAYVASKFSNAMLVVDADLNGDGDISDAAVVGRILLLDADNSAWASQGSSVSDDDVTGLDGFGGQGVLAVPVVYNGWVQELPDEWKEKLTEEQLNPVG